MVAHKELYPQLSAADREESRCAFLRRIPKGAVYTTPLIHSFAAPPAVVAQTTSALPHDDDLRLFSHPLHVDGGGARRSGAGHRRSGCRGGACLTRTAPFPVEYAPALGPGRAVAKQQRAARSGWRLELRRPPILA